jgi:hypothetical protein
MMGRATVGEKVLCARTELPRLAHIYDQGPFRKSVSLQVFSVLGSRNALFNLGGLSSIDAFKLKMPRVVTP